MRLIDADALIEYIKAWGFIGETCAIEAVEDMPTIEPCEDAISRGYILHELNGYGADWREDCEIADIIRNAPSVAPSRPKGENLQKDFPSLFECSVCGESCFDTVPWDCDINYCPNCGADMRKGRKENPLAGIKPKSIPTKKHTFMYRKGVDDEIN